MRVWAALLLPGLLLRALVPVGFMPTFGPGWSLGLVLCAAYAPISPMDMSNMDMPMDAAAATGSEPDAATAPQPLGRGHRSGDYQQHSLCPYAKSATSAPAPAALSLPGAPAAAASTALMAAQIFWFQAPARAQSPRAPPSPA